jgi:hypothetical protein
MSNLRTRIDKLARQLVKPPSITMIYICPTDEDGNSYLYEIWNLLTGERADCRAMGIKIVDGDVERAVSEYAAQLAVGTPQGTPDVPDGSN